MATELHFCGVRKKGRLRVGTLRIKRLGPNDCISMKERKSFHSNNVPQHSRAQKRGKWEKGTNKVSVTLGSCGFWIGLSKNKFADLSDKKCHLQYVKSNQTLRAVKEATNLHFSEQTNISLLVPTSQRTNPKSQLEIRKDPLLHWFSSFIFFICVPFS